jgi:peptide deformylase
MKVVTYGHPALRSQGRKVTNVDSRLRQFAADMIKIMRDKDGIGLAAQQVGLPLQMFVLEVLQNMERPSQMWKSGNSILFDPLMPLVVVNPEIETEGEMEIEGEGCLSFPGIFGKVARPARVYLRAHDLEGEPIEFLAEGLLARAVQHEFDHLQGVLFIERMDPETRQELEPAIATLKNQGGG